MRFPSRLLLAMLFGLIAAPASAQQLIRRHSLQDGNVALPPEVEQAGEALESCLRTGLETEPARSDRFNTAREILGGCESQIQSYRELFDQLISTLPTSETDRSAARGELERNIGLLLPRLETRLLQMQD